MRKLLEPTDSAELWQVFHESELAVFNLWTHHVEAAYLTARGERRAELKGEDDGMARWRRGNAFTESWGAVRACEALFPELMHAGASRDAIRIEARRDAWVEFRDEFAEQVAA